MSQMTPTNWETVKKIAEDAKTRGKRIVLSAMSPEQIQEVVDSVKEDKQFPLEWIYVYEVDEDKNKKESTYRHRASCLEIGWEDYQR